MKAFLSVFCLGSGINFAADKEPIPIGLIALLRGYLLDEAQNLVEAQYLAVEEIDSKGEYWGGP